MVNIVTGGSAQVDNVTIQYNAQNQLELVNSPEWIKVSAGALTVAAGGGITSIAGSLGAKKLYKLILVGAHATDTVGAAQLHFNASAAANYYRARITNTTIDVSTGATGIQFASDGLKKQICIVYFSAVSGSQHEVRMVHKGENATPNQQELLGGGWTTTDAITAIGASVAGSATRTWSGDYALYYQGELA